VETLSSGAQNYQVCNVILASGGIDFSLFSLYDRVGSDWITILSGVPHTSGTRLSTRTGVIPDLYQ